MKKITFIDETKIKEFIYNFKEKNNRFPDGKEFSLKNGCPYCYNIITKEYKGINNLYKKLNISFNKTRKKKLKLG